MGSNRSVQRKFRLSVLIAVALTAATPRATDQQNQSKTGLDVVALLELYDAGRFDEAIAAVKSAGDAAARSLREQLRTEGSEWIDAARPNHGRRLLVAAAFALETETLRVERGDWGSSESPSLTGARYSAGGPGRPSRLMFVLPLSCQTICMLDWSQVLLRERGLSDPAARAWFHVAIGLAEGQRDWKYVYTLLGPEATAPGSGLAHEATTAFPDDTWFQFDRALAMAARHNVTRDGIAPGSAVIIPAPPMPSRTVTFQSPNRTVSRTRLGGGGGPERGTVNLPSVQPVSALDELTRLSADRVVGIDAQIRLGYLQWTTGDSDAAQATLKVAAAAAQDNDRRYLAHFLAGWTALRDGHDDVARESLTAALESRPNSQSATLALASLELRRGDADAAHARAEAALAERARDDDPWRLFLYGRYPTMTKLIDDLRAAVRR